MIDKFVEILNGNEISDQSTLTPIMTLEFLLIICLPLLGFSGDPLSYEPNYDVERPYQRQMALRILSKVDPKRASNNLVYLEEKISIWLNLP